MRLFLYRVFFLSNLSFFGNGGVRIRVITKKYEGAKKKGEICRD